MYDTRSEEHKNGLLSDLRRHVLQLNGAPMLSPSQDATRVVAMLMDIETAHSEVAVILFHFLKSPTGEPITPNVGYVASEIGGNDGKNATKDVLRRVIDFEEPFGTALSLPALRNWFMLINHIASSAVGSEGRLKFKYSLLTPLALLALHMARGYPEFLARLTDYLEGWKKRVVFDSEAIEILFNAYRGDVSAIESSIAHTNGQTASHFIFLREEYLNRRLRANDTSRGEMLSNSADTANSVVGAASAGGETSNLLPSYLMELMVSWNSSSEGGLSGSGEKSGEVAEWYRAVVGEKVLGKIENGRSEIEEKYSPLLMKFRSMDANEVERAKGQLLVLLKREFKRRTELINEELQLIALLDSRHALMTRKFDLFARLKLFLDKSVLQAGGAKL